MLGMVLFQTLPPGSLVWKTCLFPGKWVLYLIGIRCWQRRLMFPKLLVLLWAWRKAWLPLATVNKNNCICSFWIHLLLIFSYFFVIFLLNMSQSNKNSSPQWTQWYPSFPVGQEMSKRCMISKRCCCRTWEMWTLQFKSPETGSWRLTRNNWKFFPFLPSEVVAKCRMVASPASRQHCPSGTEPLGRPSAPLRQQQPLQLLPTQSPGQPGRGNTATSTTWIRPPKSLNCAKHHSTEILFQYN